MRANFLFETPDNKTKKVRERAECPQCGGELVSPKPEWWREVVAREPNDIDSEPEQHRAEGQKTEQQRSQTRFDAGRCILLNFDQDLSFLVVSAIFGSTLVIWSLGYKVSRFL